MLASDIDRAAIATPITNASATRPRTISEQRQPCGVVRSGDDSRAIDGEGGSRGEVQTSHVLSPGSYAAQYRTYVLIRKANDGTGGRRSGGASARRHDDRT